MFGCACISKVPLHNYHPITAEGTADHKDLLV